MNDRINELFGQALDQAVPETWTTLDPAQLSRLKAKFAELIVRECAGVCENSNYQFGTIFTKMIKEHFGVEE